MPKRFRLTGAIAALAWLAVALEARATPILSEGFDSVSALAGAGWVLTNNSDPAGTTGWFQGNPGVFGAQAGVDNAYVAANFQNAALGGNISNWLLTPALTIQDGDTLHFWTRTELGSLFPDRLEVRLSTMGASANVGSDDASVGDFMTLLLTINPALAVPGYPEAWTQFSATVSGLAGVTTGRYAFRYFVTDTELNANYIGIDTVSVEAVSEPGTLLLVASGALVLLRRRRLLSPR